MNQDLPDSISEETPKAGIEIGVMGSARLGEDDPRWSQAHTLGRLLAQEGYTVVTGGYGGLMAAVSRGAHEVGGRVIGLPMQHWENVAPNRWNAHLRWSSDYGTRLNHVLRCDGVIALPGGIGTLSEMSLTWAASQTEGRPLPLVLLGDCWHPLIQTIREHLIVGDADLQLLCFADTPEEALREMQEGLGDSKWQGRGPYG